MISRLTMILAVPAVVTLAACTSPAAQHEAGCIAGTLAGGAIGGAIGNRFGGGTGQTILTGTGAFIGAASAANSMNCVRY